MSTLRHFSAEILWLATAGIAAWTFPKTFIAIQIVAGVITITMMQVERHFR